MPLGQGNGTQMIRRIESELKQRGSTGVHLGELSSICTRLSFSNPFSLLGMAPNNTKALQFYTKLGFKVLAERNNTLWLGKHLS